ncbi:alpha/beta hydrolase [Rhodococcus fascians]|nr:alpha/beta hydrolase [Rhodococcus fascians]
MVSIEARTLDAALRNRPNTSRVAPTLEQLRRNGEAMGTFGTKRDDVTIGEVDMGGRRALEYVPDGVGDGIILYLHGGGLTLGSPESHTRLAAHLAARSRARVYNLDYRLAPEHPFPAALDDVAAAFRFLTGRGVPAERIIIGGDSGGAAIALATLVDLTESGHRLAGGLFMSPWVDFTLTADSFETNADLDPMCSRQMMVPLRDNYCPSGDFENHRVSPALNGNLTGLPPLLVQVGASEVLRDDARLIAERGLQAGVEVDIEEYAGVPHVFQLYAGNLPEADDALQSAADWTTLVLGRRHREAG